jgi:hypothetical protein
MKKDYYKNKVCYACEVCGFAYPTQELAEACEEWCNTHHSCNMNLVKSAVNRGTKK